MSLKIIFMGTPEFSVPILKSLLMSDHKILSIYTQPPKKKNRGQNISKTPIHRFSIDNNIEVRCPENINSEHEINFIKKKNPDVIIVVAYGKILSAELLSLKNINFLNIHASLLPKWRGAAPIQRSIMNLDKETGISIMKIVPKLDEGPVMMKSKVSINKNTNAEKLSNELSHLAARMIIESLSLIEKKKAVFIEQNKNEATYAEKIRKVESKIDWNQKASQIIAKVNALYPDPGCWFEYGGSRIKINKAIEVNQRGAPGNILNDKFVIACSENAVQLLEVQKEGKKSMSVSEFLKGNELIVGTDAK